MEFEAGVFGRWCGKSRLFVRGVDVICAQIRRVMRYRNVLCVSMGFYAGLL